MAPDKKALAEAGRRKLEEFRKAKGQAGKSTPPLSPEPAPKESRTSLAQPVLAAVPTIALNGSTAATNGHVTGADSLPASIPAVPATTSAYSSSTVTSNQLPSALPGTNLYTNADYPSINVATVHDSSNSLRNGSGNQNQNQQSVHGTVAYSPPRNNFVVASGAIPFLSSAAHTQEVQPFSAATAAPSDSSADPFTTGTEQIQGHGSTWASGGTAFPAPAASATGTYTSSYPVYGSTQPPGAVQASTAIAGAPAEPAVHANANSTAQPGTTWSYVSSARALFGSPAASGGGTGADFFNSSGGGGTSAAAPAIPPFQPDNGSPTASGMAPAAAASSVWGGALTPTSAQPVTSFVGTGRNDYAPPAQFSHAKTSGIEGVAAETAETLQTAPWQVSTTTHEATPQQPLAQQYDLGSMASTAQPSHPAWHTGSHAALQVSAEHTTSTAQAMPWSHTTSSTLGTAAQREPVTHPADITGAQKAAAGDDSLRASTGMTNSSSVSQWLGLAGSHADATDAAQQQQQASSTFLFDGSHSQLPQHETSAADVVQPDLSHPKAWPAAAATRHGNDSFSASGQPAAQAESLPLDLPPPPPTQSWWSTHRAPSSMDTPSWQPAVSPGLSHAAPPPTALHPEADVGHGASDSPAGKSWWSWGARTEGDASIAVDSHAHNHTAADVVDAAGTLQPGGDVVTSDVVIAPALTATVQPPQQVTTTSVLDMPSFGAATGSWQQQGPGASLFSHEQVAGAFEPGVEAALGTQPTYVQNTQAPAVDSSNVYSLLSDEYLGGAKSTHVGQEAHTAIGAAVAAAHPHQTELSSSRAAYQQSWSSPAHTYDSLGTHYAGLEPISHHSGSSSSHDVPTSQQPQQLNDAVSNAAPAVSGSGPHTPIMQSTQPPGVQPSFAALAPSAPEPAPIAVDAQSTDKAHTSSQSIEPGGLSLADAFASFVKDEEEPPNQAQLEEQPKRGRFGWLFGAPKPTSQRPNSSSPASELPTQSAQAAVPAQDSPVPVSQQAVQGVHYNADQDTATGQSATVSSSTKQPAGVSATERTASPSHEVQAPTPAEITIGGWGQPSTGPTTYPSLPGSSAYDLNSGPHHASSNGGLWASGQQRQAGASGTTAVDTYPISAPAATSTSAHDMTQPSSTLWPASERPTTADASATGYKAPAAALAVVSNAVASHTAADSQGSMADSHRTQPDGPPSSGLPSSSAFRAGLLEQPVTSAVAPWNSTPTTAAAPAYTSPWAGANSTSAAFTSSTIAPGTSPKTTLSAPYSISSYTTPMELLPGNSQTASFLESYLDKLLVDMPRKEPEPAGDDEADGEANGNMNQDGLDADHSSQGTGSRGVADAEQQAEKGSSATSVAGHEEMEGSREGDKARLWEGGGRPPLHPGSSAQDGPYQHTRGANGMAPGIPRVASSGSQFSLLQQHIEELTEEKMELSRGLLKQTQLHTALQEENATLIERLNTQGKQIDSLKAKLDRYELELNAQVLAVEGMAAEREAARVAHDEAAARATQLAGEVVNLESELLAAKNQTLKLQKDMDARNDQVSRLEKQLASTRKDFTNANEDVGRLTQEKRALFVRLKQTESRLNKLLDETGTSSKAREALLSGLSPVKAEALDQEVQCNLLDMSEVQQLKAELEQAVMAANVAAQDAAAAREAAREADDRTRAASTELTAMLHQLKQLQEQQAEAAAAAAAATNPSAQVTSPVARQLQLTTATSQALARFSQVPNSPYSPVMNHDTPSSIITDKVLSDMPPAMQAALMAARDMPALLGPIAQLARWLPQGPVSAGSPEAAMIEEQVRLVASIHTMLDQYESAHREVVTQLQALQVEAADLRTANKELRYKLELATQRLELSLSQGAGMAAMMQAAGMTNAMVHASPGDSNATSPPMHVTYTQHLQELTASDEGRRGLQADPQSPAAPAPFNLDIATPRDAGMRMPQEMAHADTQQGGPALDKAGLGQHRYEQQQQALPYSQQADKHLQRHLHGPGALNGQAAGIFQDDLQEIQQQGRQRSGWLGVLFGRQPRPTKRIRNALL